MGQTGIAVSPISHEMASTHSIRWHATFSDPDLKIVMPGEPTPTSDVLLEVDKDALVPNLIRSDPGPILRQRITARIGIPGNWCILIIPSDGQAPDGSLHTTVGSFVTHAIETFFKHALYNWPSKPPYPVTISAGTRINTRLYVKPTFPPGTRLVVAYKNLDLQCKDIAKITYLPDGLRISENMIKLSGPMPRQVQEGCVLGLALTKTGETCTLNVYFPSHGAVIRREDYEEVKRKLSKVYTRR